MHNKNISNAVILILVSFLLWPSATRAQRRVALVIGNSAYVNAPRLENPKNDASDLASTLRQLGFEVVESQDLSKSAMDRSIRDFADRLSGAEMSLFFYAGHGLQVDGQNYIVPVDARLTSSAALDFEMVRLDLVQRTMERESHSNIIILDACRDNPLARNLARALGTRSTAIGRGLAPMESGEGTLISFSTQPGNVALDGAGRNSPFAAALLKRITAPGEDLPTILINVRNDVMAATSRRQVPWEHSALTAKVYFTPPQPVGPTAAQQIELKFWESVKDSTSPTILATYLEKYPKGEFALVARALIEHYEHQIKASMATREEENKRQEEIKKAAELKRLEEDRTARETALAEEVIRAKQAKNDAEAKRVEEQERSEHEARAEELKKALEDAKKAKEAAQAAEEQRLAAVHAAEQATKAAERVIAEKRQAVSGGESSKASALPQIKKPSDANADRLARERRAHNAGARDAFLESRKYWPLYSIPTGQSVSTTTTDGRRLTCIGGDRYGTPRRCRWN